jgi:hypothetical protein
MEPFLVAKFSLDSIDFELNSIQRFTNRTFILRLAFWGKESDEQAVFESADMCFSNLYIGLSDGSVAFYDIQHIKDKEIITRPNKRVSITKSKINQIEAVPSESKLIVHSGKSAY